MCILTPADNDVTYEAIHGYNPEEYQNEYYERIRFHIKSVCETTTPFNPVDSVNCVMQFFLPPNATVRLTEKKSTQVRCGACKRLVTDLKCQLQRTLLSDEQHVDMCNVTEAIEESGKDELDRVFAEGDAHGIGDVLRNVWCTDLKKQKKQFMADQANNGKWSL